MGRKKGVVYMLIGTLIVCLAWYFLAKAINRSLILPDFLVTMHAFFTGWFDKKVMSNLSITLVRVFTGSAYAIAIGLPLGLLMGYSHTALVALSPYVNSIRQVPIMAWVPLSIIWFGLGDGPTIFMITMSAVFPILINTISGVMDIDPNYKNAARCMGAGTWQVMRDVVVPGALPSFLTGCRLALGGAWMSVICAEFIATSKGFGYIMVEAQVRMKTPLLYALMIMSAIVGFAMDKSIVLLERSLTGWRYKNDASDR
ncbi:ABC transporter permease subunit SaoP [Pyramidobacter sp.]|uniref:ABC transporter permease subunit SaoP n=1 Tax=Pyramidobacter sp. TaxID=1943581 RepID=UPI0039C5B5A8